MVTIKMAIRVSKANKRLLIFYKDIEIHTFYLWIFIHNLKRSLKTELSLTLLL